MRNSWVTKPDRKAAGFWDAAEWEEVKLKTRKEIQKWIDKQLDGTSVTVVLIGAETLKREYVQYEVEQSIARGNGILGIRIHSMKGVDGEADTQGANPLPTGYKIYDWVKDDGRENLGKWVEDAAKQAGR